MSRSRTLPGLIFTLAVALPSTAIRGADAPAAGRQLLRGVEERASFDGGSRTVIAFRKGSSLLSYSPPAGWTLKTGANRVVMSKGKMEASLVLTAFPGESIPEMPSGPTSEELKQFEIETARRMQGIEQPVAPASLLPFQIGNQAVTASTIAYRSKSVAHLLQRVKSWGRSWQVEMEITGPRLEFTEAQTVLWQSLCSIDLQTSRDREAAAVAREEEALARLADEQKKPAPAPRTGKVRGRLP